MPVWHPLNAGSEYLKLNVQKQVVLMLWLTEVFFFIIHRFVTDTTIYAFVSANKNWF